MQARPILADVAESSTPGPVALARPALFFFLVPAGFVACAGAGGQGGLLSDTLSTGRVVVSNPDPGGAAPLRLVEELRIGSIASTGPDAFGNVGSLAIDQTGSIYVGDYAAEEVRSFGVDGTFLRVVTRRGPGPGEIPASVFPFNLLWQEPKRLWIGATPTLFFLDSLGNAGNVVHRLPSNAPWTPHADTLEGIYGRRLDLVEMEPSRLVFESWVERLAVSEDGAISVAGRLLLGRIEHRVGQTITRGGARGNLMQTRPMQGETPWTVDPAGEIWLAEAPYYALHRVTIGGDTVRTVKLSRVPAPLTRRERADLAASSPFSAEELPAHKPLIRDIKAGPDGWLWVRLWSSNPRDDSWDIFDPCGRHLGQLTPHVPLDARPWLPDRGARLLAVTRDAFDVETVVRFRAETDSGAPVVASDCVPP